MTFKQYYTKLKKYKKYKKLDFTPDGREHYVYRVTDYTRDVNQHYYGSHTPPKNKKYDSLIAEFWTYRTSSKKNVLNEDTKENYKVKILKVFDNPADKMIYEAYLHQYFDVKRNNNFWNGSNQTPFGFDTTGKQGPNKNKPMSEISKKRLRISKSKVDQKTGLTGYQITGLNGANTRKKVDPETGLTIDQMNGLKLKKVLNIVNPETGFTPKEMSMKKLAITRKKVDLETGLTLDEKRGINSAKTRKQINSETGLSIDQMNGICMAEKRKKVNPETGLSNFEECGKKLSEKLNSIDPETGIRYADKYGISRRKYYDIYHIEKGLLVSNVVTSDLPFSNKHCSKETCIGRTQQSINAMKKENKKYIGCYVVKK